MIFLVVAPNRDWFFNVFDESGLFEKAEKVDMSRTIIFMKNGDEYRFIGNDINKLRGFHGIRVLFWGPSNLSLEAEAEFMEQARASERK